MPMGKLSFFLKKISPHGSSQGAFFISICQHYARKNLYVRSSRSYFFSFNSACQDLAEKRLSKGRAFFESQFWFSDLDESFSKNVLGRIQKTVPFLIFERGADLARTRPVVSLFLCALLKTLVLFGV